ncbi:MAG: hypothetical protein OSB47_02135, partial [Pirellulaceae bacterium]|nr:hypothetical protein [Pirellulaceae bacterium]
IDESTALLVQGSTGTVLGGGKVHIYDWRQAPEPGKPDYQSFPTRSRYDLAKRKVLFLPPPPEPTDKPEN